MRDQIESCSHNHKNTQPRQYLRNLYHKYIIGHYKILVLKQQCPEYYPLAGKMLIVKVESVKLNNMGVVRVQMCVNPI